MIYFLFIIMHYTSCIKNKNIYDSKFLSVIFIQTSLDMYPRIVQTEAVIENRLTTSSEKERFSTIIINSNKYFINNYSSYLIYKKQRNHLFTQF